MIAAVRNAQILRLWMGHTIARETCQRGGSREVPRGRHAPQYDVTSGSTATSCDSSGPATRPPGRWGSSARRTSRIERWRDLSDDEKWRAVVANNARIRELAKRLVERDEEAEKARTPAGGARRAQDDRSALLRAIRQVLSSENLQ
jgi:hypothetical protein